MLCNHVQNLEHCPQHLILEEIYSLEGVNCLLIGVSECVFHSKKILFEKDRLLLGFELSDKEIVFGDLSEIREALIQLQNNHKYKSICILTCIPEIINLDLSYLIESVARDVIVIHAPDFLNKNGIEVLQDLYYELFKNSKIFELIDDTYIWKENEKFSKYNDVPIGSIEKALAHKRHIIKDPKFLKLLRAVKEKNDIEVNEEYICQ